jgi:predicted nucleic acid-binding protein
VRFWDASALVPLLVAERRSEWATAELAEDRAVAVWSWTQVELVSAVERRARDGGIAPATRRALLTRVDELCSGFAEVTDVVAVRQRARRLLARHALRAADASQLAAALLVGEVSGSGPVFVCLDERLAVAAEREGLEVLPPPG